jgi:hypothetical protein
MTVTLHLKPEVEAGLLAHAQASGLTVEAILLSVVEGAVFPAAQKTASSEERAAAFEAWSFGHRATPPLSESAVSRDALHEFSEIRGDRAEAVRRMLAFGDKYRLSLGEPMTRELLHEGHRF